MSNLVASCVACTAALAWARFAFAKPRTFDARPKRGYQFENVRVFNLLLCDYVAYTVRDTSRVTASIAPHLVLRNHWYLSVFPTTVLE
jgi:hypothetical protein